MNPKGSKLKTDQDYRRQQIQAMFKDLNKTRGDMEVKQMIAAKFDIGMGAVMAYLQGIEFRNRICACCKEMFVAKVPDVSKYCLSCKIKKFPSHYRNKEEKPEVKKESEFFDWKELKGHSMSFHNSWQGVENNINPSHNSLIERKERGYRATG